MLKFSIYLMLFFSAFTDSQAFRKEIVIGSKKFTESVILGEMMNLILLNDGFNSKHIKQLGGTRILWNALLSGEIDAYPEYTGTIYNEIFADSKISNFKQLSEELKRFGIGVSKPLGFNNTYAIGVRADVAEKYHLRKISDLRNYPDLVFGFTNEFMDRNDGWKELKKVYNLKSSAKGIDHDLAYAGIRSRGIDVIDLYTTDAEIKYYNLKILQDDKKYFSEYLCVILYRKDLPENAVAALKRIEGKISESEMIQMNSKVKIQKISETKTAADFLYKKFNIFSQVDEESATDLVIRATIEHLQLVLVSMIFAIFTAVPLGIYSFKNKKFGAVIMGFVNILQTIPSLALLVFMIPLFGIGTIPAIVALYLYSLLPIVRNAYLGLAGIPQSLKDSAAALGLSSKYRLFKIELPLALRSILSGIKISTVINIGTATLGALIGAGGYGQPILTGIRLADTNLVLLGAIPAALLAILAQFAFELIEKFVLPKGLKT